MPSVVLSLERLVLLHVNVTSHPHAAWTAQQIVEALEPDTPAAGRLIRDRDGIYGAHFDTRVNNLGVEQLRTAPRSPWQNGCVERVVGTLRRELLDHVVVLGAPDSTCRGECAGINRQKDEDERALHRRSSDPRWPRVMRERPRGCARSVRQGHVRAGPFNRETKEIRGADAIHHRR